MMATTDTSLNHSQYTRKRVDKLTHLSEKEREDLLKTLEMSDMDLATYNKKYGTKKDKVSMDAADYLAYHDEKLNRQQKTYEDNKLGGTISKQFDMPEISKEKREYLVNMFFSLSKRHADYQKEKATYTPEQRAIVEKIEKESGGKVKCVVDTNFLKAFGKITGVDYRGAGVLGERVIVGDPKDLLSEPLLRHEAIHCAQQRDMGFMKRLARSVVESKRKQFTGPEKGTASAVDYGTDNHLLDRETYINQYNSQYLAQRKSGDHNKYANKNILQKEYKRAREDELRELKEQLGILQDKENEGQKLTFAEIDQKKKLQNDIKQFEKILNHLENDTESRVVLVEPDVLPSKRDKYSEDYDEKAQVWTESKVNMDKRIKLEKGLYKEYQKKLEERKEALMHAVSDQEKQEIEKDIKEYEVFLTAIKGDRDKSRKKSKQDRKELQAKREQMMQG